MRTTVTIDSDTEALLREEVARTGSSFKVVLNESIRRALARPSKSVTIEPLFKAPFPGTLDGRSFNHLATEWEDEDARGFNEAVKAGTEQIDPELCS